MFIAFLTRFNSEFQEMALPELKIGAVVSVGFLSFISLLSGMTSGS